MGVPFACNIDMAFGPTTIGHAAAAVGVGACHGGGGGAGSLLYVVFQCRVIREGGGGFFCKFLMGGGYSKSLEWGSQFR